MYNQLFSSRYEKCYANIMWSITNDTGKRMILIKNKLKI